MNKNEATGKIKAHKQYSESDYAYLREKGYTNAEILKFWDRDQAEGKLPVGVYMNDLDIVEFFMGKIERY